jgi:hypothetical protein
MRRAELLNLIIDNFNIKENDQVELIEFFKNNNDTPNKDFQKKLDEEFPDFDYYLKYHNSIRLKKIASHLLFFKIITIIAIAIPIIYGLYLFDK